jgi:transposase InsO family protein
LIHDRDLAFQGLMATAEAIGIHDVRTAPRSPWQNAYVERFIGSIRRECLDHVIVLNAAGLRTILKSYLAYYTNSRTHLSLDKDAPQSRPVCHLGGGCVTAISQVGGFHHRYERCAA